MGDIAAETRSRGGDGEGGESTEGNGEEEHLEIEREVSEA
jgi:hypothetical protein